MIDDNRSAKAYQGYQIDAVGNANTDSMLK